MLEKSRQEYKIVSEAQSSTQETCLRLCELSF